MQKKISEFDYSKYVQKDLREHLKAIETYCHKNKIPYFLTICTKSTPTETEYIADALVPIEMNLTLADDQIRKMICVKRGFEVFPVKIDEFEVDEVAADLQGKRKKARIKKEGL